MIELQTIRRGDTRQIIRIKGILPKDRLPPEYTSNKSGQKCAFWKEIVDGKEVLVLHGHGLISIREGDTISESAFQVVVGFMYRAGNRLHSINTSKKLGIGIRETVRI
ncbi:MAG: hypothetical protein MUO43_11810 [Desulfobacterales bacterium]|nr:hypothetical protein [Desulfobacterales bacterium]